jgi:hypothetical protein
MKRILKEAGLIAEKYALAMDENQKPAFLSSKEFRVTARIRGSP